MKKNIIFSIFAALILSLSFSTVALAVDQNPRADMYLGPYDLVKLQSEYSDYCTATKDHMILQITNTSGEARYQVQSRAPNGGWKNMDYRGNANGVKNVDLNVKKGYDYRMKITVDFLTAKGFVTCI